MLLDQVADAEHDLGAPADARGAPGRERRVGGGDGRVDLLDRGEVDLSRDLAGGRVVDRAAAAARARHAGAVDPVVDPIQPGRCVASAGARQSASWRALCLRGEAPNSTPRCSRVSRLPTGMDSDEPPERMSRPMEQPRRTCALCDDPIDSTRGVDDRRTVPRRVARSGLTPNRDEGHRGPRALVAGKLSALPARARHPPGCGISAPRSTTSGPSRASRSRPPAHRPRAALRAEPVVGIELADVVPAGVGQQDDEQGVRVVDLPRELQRRPKGRAARLAHQDPLAPRGEARREHRVAVAHLDDHVAGRRVVRGRPEVLADPLGQVRARRGARVEGSGRVRPDDRPRTASRSLRYRPAPETVPPVPSATTKCVTRPPVASQISGPVVA